MAYLNHDIPTITCYLRNQFMFNHEKGFDEFTLCDVHGKMLRRYHFQSISTGTALAVTSRYRQGQGCMD